MTFIYTVALCVCVSQRSTPIPQDDTHLDFGDRVSHWLGTCRVGQGGQQALGVLLPPQHQG